MTYASEINRQPYSARPLNHTQAALIARLTNVTAAEEGDLNTPRSEERGTLEPGGLSQASGPRITVTKPFYVKLLWL